MARNDLVLQVYQIPKQPLSRGLARQQNTACAKTADGLLADPDDFPKLFLSNWLVKHHQETIAALISHNTTPLRDTRNSPRVRRE